MNTSSNSQDNPFRNWLPQTSLTALRQEITDLMENFFGESLSHFKTASQPRIDVSETADAVVITSDLPGFKKSEIGIDLGEKSLTISGTRTAETTDTAEGVKFHKVERHTGRFSRTIWLPCPVNEDNVEAKLENGILTIRLSKRVDATRRKVEIQGD